MTFTKYGLLTPVRSPDEPQEITSRVTMNTNLFLEKGVYTLPDNTQENGTYEILTQVNGEQDGSKLIRIPANKQITIIETIEGEGKLVSSTELTIGKNSNVRYVVISKISETSSAWLHYHAHAEHSNAEWLFLGVGGAYTRADITTTAGNNVNAKNTAIIIGKNNQVFDIHTNTVHNGSQSRSDMLSRNVVDNKARVINHGLIRIEANASEVDSYQKDEAIMLSDGSSADAIPNLEIHNHNVRCSHGASIGRIDAEKLFYLNTRGISENDAKLMITRGFIESAIPEDLRERTREYIGNSEESK